MLSVLASIRRPWCDVDAAPNQGGRRLGGPRHTNEKEYIRMKRNSKWTIRLAATGLAALCLCGGAALAAAGDRQDPLVTLSYLTETVTPDILKSVDKQSEKKQSELETRFAETVAEYRKQMQELVDAAGAGGGGQTTGSASYTLVTLTSGQRLALGVGCEVLLRVGTATVQSSTAPALIDVTTGGTLNSGGSLTANHLYMATIADRTVQATAATVKMLVRGEYTLS